ncbi:MAG: FKBP-type peptidyl-prolyl cis-trans isomerase [Nanoarchaeota archaeon]
MFHKIKGNKNLKFASIIIGAFIIILLVGLIVKSVLGDRAQLGDTISIEYSLYLENGSLMDTNVKSVADKYSIDTQHYEPLTFILGSGQIIKGLDDALINSKAGDKLKVSIKPEEGYGKYDYSLVQKGMPRTVDVGLYSDIPTDKFQEIFGEDPVVGKVIKNDNLPWAFSIIKIEENIVKVKSLVEKDNKVKVQGYDYVVQDINNENITLYSLLKIGDKLTLNTPYGAVPGVIISMNDTSFDIDTNHPLADKVLVFDVEVLEVKKK